MDWSKYYPANWSAVTAEDVRMIREKKLAPVDKDAVKQDWKDRSDDDHVDIDKDGDEDNSDKFLHKKRKAITKAIEAAEAMAMDPAIARAKAAEASKKKQLQTQQGGVRKPLSPATPQHTIRHKPRGKSNNRKIIKMMSGLPGIKEMMLMQITKKQILKCTKQHL